MGRETVCREGSLVLSDHENVKILPLGHRLENRPALLTPDVGKGRPRPEGGGQDKVRTEEVREALSTGRLGSGGCAGGCVFGGLRRGSDVALQSGGVG